MKLFRSRSSKEQRKREKAQSTPPGTAAPPESSPPSRSSGSLDGSSSSEDLSWDEEKYGDARRTMLPAAISYQESEALRQRMEDVSSGVKRKAIKGFRAPVFSGREAVKWMMKQPTNGWSWDSSLACDLLQAFVEMEWISPASPTDSTFVNSRKSFFTLQDDATEQQYEFAAIVDRARAEPEGFLLTTQRFKKDVSSGAKHFTGSQAIEWMLQELSNGPWKEAIVARGEAVSFDIGDARSLVEYMFTTRFFQPTRGKSHTDLHTFREECTYEVAEGSSFAACYMKCSTSSKRIGLAAARKGWKGQWPIMMIPGLASSALEVWKSDIHPQWERERLWLDVSKIGDAAVVKKFKNMMSYSKAAEEHSRQRLFLHHLCLGDDGFSDPPGIRVRPAEGIGAIDYLSHAALTRGPSYVWAHVIRNLMDVGYSPRDLQAAPYDWRLPMSKLEERDGYYTMLKARLEAMRKINGKPVVVICHSMGNRVFQYFLQWVLHHRDGGQTWIDTNVHAYMALGAPFLGAPKVVRGVVSGDALGLEMFLLLKESLMFGRTLGSLPCMMPLHHAVHPQPITYMKASSHTEAVGMVGNAVGNVVDGWREHLVWEPSSIGGPVWELVQQYREMCESDEDLEQYAVFNARSVAGRWFSPEYTEPPRVTDSFGNETEACEIVADHMSKWPGFFCDRPQCTLQLHALPGGLRMSVYDNDTHIFEQSLFFGSLDPIHHQIFGRVLSLTFFADDGKSLVILTHAPEGLQVTRYRIPSGDFSRLEYSSSFVDKNRHCAVAVERVYEKVKRRDLGKKEMSQQERFDLRWLKNENNEPKDQAALLRTLGDGHDKYLRMYETLSAGVPAGNAITSGLLVGEFQLDRAASQSHAPLLTAAAVTGIKREVAMLGLDDPKQLLLVASDCVALSFHVVAERDSILSYSTPLLQPGLRVSFGVFGAGVGFAWITPRNEAHVFVVKLQSGYFAVITKTIASTRLFQRRVHFQWRDEAITRASAVDVYYNRVSKAISESRITRANAPGIVGSTTSDQFTGVNPLSVVLTASPTVFDNFRINFVQNKLFLAGVSGSGDEAFERKLRTVAGLVSEEEKHCKGDHPDCAIAHVTPPVLGIPPVKRLWHMYGVNLPTEVSYYFEVDQETKEVTLDKSADQMSEHVQEGNPAGLRIRGGIGYEVPSTPQPSLDMRKRSGDGTVPYCSLSHTTQWKCQAQREKRDIEIEIAELERVEHRAMMKDDAMIFNLLSWVCRGELPPGAALQPHLEKSCAGNCE